ncbi:MAG: hypothetical protein ACUVXB_14295 [Bryobacteraceae bacterium]
MRKSCFFTVCTLLAVGLLALSLKAQSRLPEGRAVAPPAGVAIGVGGHKYLRSYATPDPEGPTVHCEGKGIDCIVDARLLQPSRLTPIHDATLQQATLEANRILEQVQRSAPAGKALCLYRSIHGPVLIWRQAGGRGAAAGEDARLPAGAITEPAAIAKLLGIQPASQRRIAGGNLKAELVWDADLKHYVWSCKSQGTNCVIHGSFAGATARTVFDATLAQATEQLNNLFERVAARPPKPGLRLCLLMLPAGPVLAWTLDGTASPAARQQGIDSSSPDFDRLSREALGL